MREAVSEVPSGSLLRSRPREIAAFSMGSEAVARLANNDYNGSVHSCFNKAFNILFPHDELVTVVDPTIGPGPFNIVVDLPRGKTFHETFHISEGESMHGDKNRIVIGDSFLLDTQQCEIYRSRHDFRTKLLAISDIEENISVMISTVTSSTHFCEEFNTLLRFSAMKKQTPKRTDEKVPSNIFARRITDYMRSLLTSIEIGDLEGVRTNSFALIGLGPGLTPSADDILSGLLTSNYLLTENLDGDLRFVRSVNKAILEHANQTTIVSRNYLRQAALGNGTLGVISVIEKLLTLPSNSKDFQQAILDLLAVGATSGTDIALGVILGSLLALESAKKNLQVI